MARLNIINGPSKFDVMIALFDGDCHHRRSVTFTTPYGVIDVLLNDLGREDGSGECWNFKGLTDYFHSGQRGIRKPNQIVAGFFRTSNRTGHLQIAEG